jgi:hypothetical protein
MSDRKVINKYYPKDYDPSKLKRDRSKRGQNVQTKVRMALPMSVQCVSCGNFMARGSKFNARKEKVIGEEYLGISALRFYFRCTKCFQELTIKTDPKISDYVAEHGIKANFILHKAGEAEDALEAEEKEKLELFDKMKLLEQKSIASLAETEINDAIDTVLMLQSRRAQLSTEELHNRALSSIFNPQDIIESEEDLTQDELDELIEMENAMQRRASKIDEDEEDPIAARSRLARQRIESQRNGEWIESPDGQKDSSSLSMPPPSSHIGPIVTPSTSDSSKSMLPPKSSSLLKPGWSVKPVKEKSDSVQEDSPQPSLASSTDSKPVVIVEDAKPSTSLTGRKYARREEEE